MVDEKRAQECADILDISVEEAIQMLLDDEKIDKGEKLFELTPEQKKAEKKYKNVNTKEIKAVDAYGRTRTRTKKADSEKGELIQMLINGLENITNLNITNPEREFEFIFQNRKFKVVLSAPRK